ncbi:DNA polymerase IV [Lacunisphaera limnophila]|uniref:DNA-directed DNA polymerase n=1 Tax=Lacunisphaera limnophila TaxID=1838286 RepID=A0A1D8AYP1_9BACT|nr:DNA polymerase IV [Lacunisphaera limnophila]AOS46010.1 DNA polymerase IV [Lacunisphaera limnophila]
MSVLPLIVHLDADAFFVSCELSVRPELRGTKCAVGGRERGIISSASYEARACGVYTPMPTKLALKVCPDLILLPHTSGIYSKKSREMFDRCESVTPLVQRNSIDEGYLDLGPCGFKTAAEIERRMRALQQQLWDELQIPTSFGIASNKLVSAIASKARKPKGFTVVPPGQEAAFLAPLKISVIPGVGKKSEERLAAAGIRLVSDLFTRSEGDLKALFGSAWSEMLEMARGEDDRPVETDHEDAKSYSVQETFGQDISDFAEIECIAKRMIDELMPAIRADGKRVKTMTVKVRYPGMENSTAGRSLTEATDLEAPFYPLVRTLLPAAWTKRRPLRLVSVRFSGVEEKGAQLEMFAQTDEKKRRLAAVLDKLNDQGKKGVVRHGHQLGKTEDHGLHG